VRAERRAPREARLGRDPAIARHVLALVGDAARRGGSLSERFFAFVRRGELRAEPVDAAALLGRVGEALARTLAAPLRIRVDAAPDLPPVLADPEELEAVLASLAANARDAMPEGGTLTLGAALDDVAPTPRAIPGSGRGATSGCSSRTPARAWGAVAGRRRTRKRATSRPSGPTAARTSAGDGARTRRASRGRGRPGGQGGRRDHGDAPAAAA
jgi:hypothetical protein